MIEKPLKIRFILIFVGKNNLHPHYAQNVKKGKTGNREFLKKKKRMLGGKEDDGCVNAFRRRALDFF